MTLLHVFLFSARILLSAAGDTQWWKPQETCELTERVVRARSTISVPPAHRLDKQQHHFLWVTIWQDPKPVTSLALSMHEAWQTVLRAFNLLMPYSQERERCDVCWRHMVMLPTAHMLSLHIHTHRDSDTATTITRNSRAETTSRSKGNSFDNWFVFSVFFKQKYKTCW